MQQMVKHAECVSEFHSENELLYAGILESDPCVVRYVPQPFEIKIPGRDKPYVPDFYISYKNGSGIVAEVTTASHSKGRPKEFMQRRLKAERMEYSLVLTETIWDQETLARNWLFIVQLICSGSATDTSAQEKQIRKALQVEQRLSIFQLLDFLQSSPYHCVLTGLARMLHRNELIADFENSPIGLSTWITR